MSSTHPSGHRSPPPRAGTDLAGLEARLAARLRRGGVRHPDVAAAALVTRGRRDLPVDDWARELDVPPGMVRSAERGELAWDEVPSALAARCRR